MADERIRREPRVDRRRGPLAVPTRGESEPASGTSVRDVVGCTRDVVGGYICAAEDDVAGKWSGLDEQLARIAAKVRAAAGMAANHATFGATKHRFELNAPLSEDAVCAFEQDHGVRLPEAYRRFVIEVGDGGAGPTYGVLSLADAYGEVSDLFPGHLRAPSPFSPGTSYPETWWEEFTDEQRRRDPCQGTIAVVHHGCTSYTLLILSGPARGRLVSIDYNGVPAPYMLEDTDFLAWYERWLDGLAGGYDVSRVFDTIPGDEPALLAVATSANDPDRRARATWSLGALPALSPPGREVLAVLATDPTSLVRRTALRIGGQVHAAQILQPARRALRDSDPAVRAAAITALRDLAPADLDCVARDLLVDPDAEVVSRAAWCLSDLKATTVADLAPLTRSADPRIRVIAFHGLRHAAGPGAEGVLSAALDDPEARVRWTAVQAIEHRKLRQLQPKLVQLLEAETDPTVLVNLHRVIPALTTNQSNSSLPN